VAHPEGLTGILLVGGASRRFGSPKALARLGDRTLAEIAWALLGAACDHRLAVGKLADGLALPFPVVDDGVPLRASLAGLVAGLRVSPTELNVVVPVDCPGLTVAALHALAAACGDAAVTARGPLPGAYRRSALAALGPALEAGRLSVRAALEDLDVAVVPLDEDRLVNVNTPDDLVQFAARGDPT
jgi:molybdopterin-guanine dinucleotide biosynthesis protein A